MNKDQFREALARLDEHDADPARTLLAHTALTLAVALVESDGAEVLPGVHCEVTDLDALLEWAIDGSPKSRKKARCERIGRPRLAPAGVVRRIVMDRNAGLSFGRIARALEAEGVLSPAGRTTWQESTVRRIHTAATADIREAV